MVHSPLFLSTLPHSIINRFSCGVFGRFINSTGMNQFSWCAPPMESSSTNCSLFHGSHLCAGSCEEENDCAFSPVKPQASIYLAVPDTRDKGQFSKSSLAKKAGRRLSRLITQTCCIPYLCLNIQSCWGLCSWLSCKFYSLEPGNGHQAQKEWHQRASRYTQFINISYGGITFSFFASKYVNHCLLRKQKEIHTFLRTSSIIAQGI